jgi:putative flippase GtrA
MGFTGNKHRLTEFLERKDSSLLQVIKYIFCGGISVLVDQAVFYLLACWFLPCLRVTDPVVRLLSALGIPTNGADEGEIHRNYWIIKVICFIASNAVVYWLNVRYVFEAGRHRKPLEIGLFFGTALFQFFFIWLGGVLISHGWEVTTANITMLLLALMVNFIVRKKIVFKG